MASYLSRRGSNFCRFLASDVEKNKDILGIYFVRNNCVFSDAPEPVQNKIPKKVTFLGNFFHIYFLSRFLFSVMFLHCAFWVVPDVRLAVRKSANFSDAEKMAFFRTPRKIARKNDVFSYETIRCFFGSSTLIAETDTISLRQQPWT